MCSVDSLNIECRIGFGIAQLLRFHQHVRELALLFRHLGENEIPGTVNDACQPIDLVRRQTLAQRLNNGDAACHTTLEGQRDGILLGYGK